MSYNDFDFDSNHISAVGSAGDPPGAILDPVGKSHPKGCLPDCYALIYAVLIIIV